MFEVIVNATSCIPSSVKVVVRANQNDIGAIHNSDLVASINLNYLNESGTYKLPVNLKISDNVMAFDPLEIKITPEMLDVTVEEKENKLIFKITGNGFLYNMVRIIAGTLIDVGQGKKHVEEIPSIIESKERKQAGPTAPAKGLCLEKIKYL